MIDIVIATYQRQALLPGVLQSVQNQTFREWRCWISEDGNDPRTPACIKPFLDDERFIYITGEHAGFPAKPRNRAILQGTAEYIAILDDDDFWLEEKLQKQVDFFHEHSDCMMVGTNGFRWNGDLEKRDGLPLYHEKIPYGRISLDLLLTGNCFIASSVMIRRRALERSGLFQEHLTPSIGEDIELWYRLAAVGELWFMEDPLVLYRDTPPNYYDTLEKNDLKKWRIGLLQSALKGTNVPSPFVQPRNALLRKAVEDQIHYFHTGPHFLGKTGYKLKMRLGLLPKKEK